MISSELDAQPPNAAPNATISQNAHLYDPLPIAIVSQPEGEHKD